MIVRRTLLGIFAAAFAVIALAGTQFVGGSATPALAAERAEYTDAAFAEAQAAGRPILVEVWASWCPTCKAQSAVLDPLTEEPRFADLVVLRVNYDTQKDVVRAFGAFRQSTLISFKGTEEVGRLIADTRSSAIEALLEAAI